jgi:D-xylose 1-dehydrogenase (NADP+, D-xylono-1,5-lactone-forming)
VPHLRFGVVGAAWIADRAMLPAMLAARNAEPVAIAGRDPARTRALAQRHGIERVHASYEALLHDDGVDAVYIALINSLHLEWTVRALQAGKHVLCEKPLGLTATEVREMAAAAASSGRVLMEAFMYQFHPRMRALRERTAEVRSLHAAFSFPLRDPNNPRMSPALGGGALLDVGCYTLDVARWFCGTPEDVAAVAHRDGVDMSVAAVVRFVGGATATAWASFEAPEHQALVLVTGDTVTRVDQPFTAWRDPDDPYQLMVEAFARSADHGEPPPRALDESLATAELVDRVRASAFSESAAR